MCGIAGGFWRLPSGELEPRLQAALRSMRHRGPNDQGYVIHREPTHTVAIAQTRLSIIDLSSGGHQPMLTEDGSLALVFNGEIYNYRELRDELKALGRSFKSDSDTEVLLAAWQEWGRDCLTRLEGMFAFVVHDRKRARLTLARDPFGIKPLFYEQDDQGLLFASEQPALGALRGYRRGPDLQRSYDYLVHEDYDSDERTFVEGVKHLLPGMLLDVDLSSRRLAEPEVWWRPSTEETFRGSFDDAADAMRAEFLRSIKLQLRSDVPLGATLSGGIDSSAVVCAIRHIEPDMPVHTFSYIPTQSPLSEEPWIDRVNGAIGAAPHKVKASTSDLSRDLDKVIAAQGEPFGGPSVCVQYSVFQLAHAAGITVTLDGQGADELLAGYISYAGFRMHSLMEQGRYGELHRFAQRWSTWPNRSYRMAWMYLGRSILPDGLYKQARKRLGRDAEPAWLKTDVLQDAGVSLNEARSQRVGELKGRRLIEQLAENLQTRGLPKLLRHGDRNAMAFSIESRVPFLSQRIASLLFSLPESYLLGDSGETKRVFRAAMRGIVPDDVLDRRDKIGFATPPNEWQSLLAPTLRRSLEATSAIPFLNQSKLIRAFEHLRPGVAVSSRLAWRWLNYLRWYELQGFSS